MITGDSIRLAETLAQNYGNISFGVRMMGEEDGKAKVQTYCIDLETNTRAERVFSVEMSRYSKKGGNVALEDPRDKYEVMANQAARRLRSCIFEIIPGDIREAASAECEATLKRGEGDTLVDRIRKCVVAFGELGIDQNMLEKRLGHKMDATIDIELVGLIKIFKSVKDGVSKREDWFELAIPEEGRIDPQSLLAAPVKKEDAKADKALNKELEEIFNKLDPQEVLKYLKVYNIPTLSDLFNNPIPLKREVLKVMKEKLNADN